MTEIVRPVFTRLKTVDETVNNSAVLQDDNDFQFEAVASSTYLVEIYLLLTNSSIIADWQATWVLPSGTFSWGPLASNSTGLGSWEAVSTTLTPVSGVPTGVISFGGGNTSFLVRCTAIMVIGVTGGTVKFQWAQNTAQAENNTVKAGSILTYVKVN